MLTVPFSQEVLASHHHGYHWRLVSITNGLLAGIFGLEIRNIVSSSPDLEATRCQAQVLWGGPRFPSNVEKSRGALKKNEPTPRKKETTFRKIIPVIIVLQAPAVINLGCISAHPTVWFLSFSLELSQ